MRISSEIDVLGLDLDNTLTFRIRRLPWWGLGFLAPLLIMLPPNKPMLDIIRKFRKSGGKIIIISSRPRCFMKFSKLWLRKYKVPYNKIRCVGFINRSLRKLQVIQAEKVKCFIDDDYGIRNFLKENEPLIKILSPLV